MIYRFETQTIYSFVIKSDDFAIFYYIQLYFIGKMNVNKLKFPIHSQKNKSLHQKTQEFSPYSKASERRHSEKGKQLLVPLQKLTQRDGFRINKPLKSEGKSQNLKEPSKYSKEKEYMHSNRIISHASSGTNAFNSQAYNLKHSIAKKKERQSLQLVAITKKKSSTNRMVTEKLKTKEYDSADKYAEFQYSNKSSVRKMLPRQDTFKETSSKNVIRLADRKPTILEGTPEKYNSIQLRKTTKRITSEKKLTSFEREQCMNHEVFYVGSRRIQSKGDFVDAEGDPKVMIGDSIAYKYEIVDQLGRGSFGKVFKAYDHKKKEHVALKIIKSQQKFTTQAKIQVEILQTALLHDPKLRCNLVRMKNSFNFRGHACITFEILHKNLYEFLKQTNFSGFSLDLIRRFAIQILQNLLFFNHFKIIHCDLKPENILLKEENKSGIKVIDVGSGCLEHKQLYTYIQSRFYRAPEIILGIKYTSAIDVWSFGCILIELYTGFPVFPGENENQQMLMFMEILGIPPYSMLENSERRRKFFDENFKCKIPQETGKQKIPKSVTFKQILGNCDPEFIDLISNCLEWDPKKRISPKNALLHPWIVNGLPTTIRTQHIDQINNYTVR